MVNGNAAARSGEWAQHFSNASCSRKLFFSQRVINSWNSLTQHIMEALSVNSFKKRLDDYYTKLLNVEPG